MRAIKARTLPVWRGRQMLFHARSSQAAEAVTTCKVNSSRPGVPCWVDGSSARASAAPRVSLLLQAGRREAWRREQNAGFSFLILFLPGGGQLPRSERRMLNSLHSFFLVGDFYGGQRHKRSSRASCRPYIGRGMQQRNEKRKNECRSIQARMLPRDIPWSLVAFKAFAGGGPPPPPPGHEHRITDSRGFIDDPGGAASLGSQRWTWGFGGFALPLQKKDSLTVFMNHSSYVALIYGRYQAAGNDHHSIGPENNSEKSLW